MQILLHFLLKNSLFLLKKRIFEEKNKENSSI